MDLADRPVALLLPGQGSQYRRMGAGLYPDEPAFADAMDAVFSAMGRRGAGLRAGWLAEHPPVPVESAAWAQPLLFAVDYALGRLVQSWGVRPVALLGHSIGELAGAALAGVFTLADAAALVLDRVDRVATAPPGGMLAVAATPAQVEPYLCDGVVVGAVNAPRQTVLCGPAGPLGEVRAELLAAGLVGLPVPSTTGFHSPLLESTVDGAMRAYAAVPRRLPALTLFSGYTAAPVGRAEVLDPGFWARQPVDPVRFWDALSALLVSHGEVTLIECGPGTGLSSVARRHPAVRRGGSAAVALLPSRPGTPEEDRAALAAARGNWLSTAPA
jgi:acyl transferase domain-containing protein